MNLFARKFISVVNYRLCVCISSLAKLDRSGEFRTVFVSFARCFGKSKLQFTAENLNKYPKAKAMHGLHISAQAAHTCMINTETVNVDVRHSVCTFTVLISGIIHFQIKRK